MFETERRHSSKIPQTGTCPDVPLWGSPLDLSLLALGAPGPPCILTRSAVLTRELVDLEKSGCSFYKQHLPAFSSSLAFAEAPLSEFGCLFRVPGLLLLSRTAPSMLQLPSAPHSILRLSPTYKLTPSLTVPALFLHSLHCPLPIVHILPLDFP